MAHAFTPGLILTPRRRIRRLRELPVSGQILVSPGDEVNADTVVARAELPGDLHILRITEKLGIEPHEAMRGLKVSLGDEVAVNQVLCEHKGLFGLFKSQFLSPIAGKVELIAEQTGHVAVRVAPRPITIDAYISGTIAEIVPNRGVWVETDATVAQGIFGVGGERRGVLTPLNVRPDQEIVPADLPEDCTGLILFGGTFPGAQTLRAAQERKASALIVGSIDDRALTAFLGFDIGIALTGDEPISMTVITTEGFGQIPMSAEVSGLLAKCSGDLASVNGATQVRAGALRPEVIVSNTRLPAEPERNKEGLTVGSKVRLIRVPYFGLKGEVISLPFEAARIETGALARVVIVKLEDGREVTVPRANVELG